MNNRALVVFATFFLSPLVGFAEVNVLEDYELRKAELAIEYPADSPDFYFLRVNEHMYENIGAVTAYLSGKVSDEGVAMLLAFSGLSDSLRIDGQQQRDVILGKAADKFFAGDVVGASALVHDSDQAFYQFFEKMYSDALSALSPQDEAVVRNNFHTILKPRETPPAYFSQEVIVKLAQEFPDYVKTHYQKICQPYQNFRGFEYEVIRETSNADGIIRSQKSIVRKETK